MHEIVTYKGVVYPAQCDAMGHMNVQYYTAAFDIAFWHLVSECGYSAAWVLDRREGWADVHHDVKFSSELTAGSLFEVVSGIQSIGTSSVVTRHRLRRLSDDTVCAQMTAVSVYFDLEARAKKQLPAQIKERANAMLARA